MSSEITQFNFVYNIIVRRWHSETHNT